MGGAALGGIADATWRRANRSKPMGIEQALGHSICASILLRHYVLTHVLYIGPASLPRSLRPPPTESVGDIGDKAGASCIGWFEGWAKGSQGKGRTVFKSGSNSSKCAWIYAHI